MIKELMEKEKEEMAVLVSQDRSELERRREERKCV
jgi:hypothetical protein